MLRNSIRQEIHVKMYIIIAKLLLIIKFINFRKEYFQDT